jgi:WD40 repeat protein
MVANPAAAHEANSPVHLRARRLRATARPATTALVAKARLASVKAHPGGARALAVSPDGRLIASGGPDYGTPCQAAGATSHPSPSLPTIGLSPSPATTRPCASGTPTVATSSASSRKPVGFDPDGRILAAGSERGAIALWDGSTFDRLTTLRGGTGQIRNVSFSRDGGLLAGSAYVAPTIVWDLVGVCKTLREMSLDWRP